MTCRRSKVGWTGETTRRLMREHYTESRRQQRAAQSRRRKKTSDHSWTTRTHPPCVTVLLRQEGSRSRDGWVYSISLAGDVRSMTFDFRAIHLSVG